MFLLSHCSRHRLWLKLQLELQLNLLDGNKVGSQPEGGLRLRVELLEPVSRHCSGYPNMRGG